MKFRIFYSNFIVPLIVLTPVWWASFRPIQKANIISTTILVIIVFATRLILFGNRYLHRFYITESHVRIEYLTELLRSVKIQIPLSQITDVELTRRNWIVSYPSALKIKIGIEWEAFQILGRKFAKQIEGEITSRKLTTR